MADSPDITIALALFTLLSGFIGFAVSMWADHVQARSLAEDARRRAGDYAPTVPITHGMAPDVKVTCGPRIVLVDAGRTSKGRAAREPSHRPGRWLDEK
jgi:hypothetical protein